MRTRRTRRPPDETRFNSDDSIFDESLLLTLTGDSDGVTGAMTFDVESA